MLGFPGLDETATTVYRLLLRNGAATHEDIADRLGLSSPDVAEALGTLKRYSMVWNCDSENLLRPASPEHQLTTLAADQEAEALRQYHQMKSALSYVEELAIEYRTFRGEQQHGAVEVVTCAEHTRLRIAELTRGNTEEILCFTPGYQMPGFVQTAGDWRGPGGDFDRTVRSLFPDSVTKHPDRRKLMLELLGWGVWLRTVMTVPARMMVVGTRAAVLQADVGTDRGGSVLVHNRSVVLVFRDYFERVWQHASVPEEVDAFGQLREEDRDELSPAEDAALTMLAKGMTDDAIARKLDVSVRTVRRMMAQLTQRLGARSRFELAVIAAKRGWV
jgi:DNA-binding CsgD family transcriptional regulator/DNA-binding Lrp family transcriptional regulator